MTLCMLQALPAAAVAAATATTTAATATTTMATPQAAPPHLLPLQGAAALPAPPLPAAAVIRFSYDVVAVGT